MEEIYEAEEKKEKRRVMWLSIALHLLVFFLLFMPWFNAQAEKDPNELTGIYVQFSLDEGASSAEAENTKPVERPKEVKPEEKPVKSKPVEKPKVETPIKVKSETLVEDAAIVASKEDKAKKAKELAAEAEAAKRVKAEEAAKAAKEAAAKKAAAEAEAKKQAEYDASKSKFSKLFGSGSSTQKDGTTNSGNPDGDPDATKLDGLTSGKGTVGNGLGGRGILFEPTIKDSSQKTGKVVIHVCVGPEGKVISKKFTQSGSTTTDSHLVDLALKNVAKYKFTKSEIQEQCGDIVIDFRLK